MRICWVVSTYNRAHLLPRVIRCFEEQTYEDRRMLILDDAGQYGNLEGDRWKLLSTTSRFPSLGAKRNASIRLAQECFPGIEAVMPVDDDDIILPHHTEACQSALQVAEWSRPSVVLSPRIFGEHWLFTPNYTGRKDDQTKERMYHPAWGMRIDAIQRAGGYPEHLSGPEDKGLMLKMEEIGVTQADPIELGFAPSYCYVWGENNISGKLNAADRDGVQAWKSLEAAPAFTELGRWEPPFDLHNPMIIPGVRPRPF